jgi:hypothetical protein
MMCFGVGESWVIKGYAAGEGLESGECSKNEVSKKHQYSKSDDCSAFKKQQHSKYKFSKKHQYSKSEFSTKYPYRYVVQVRIYSSVEMGGNRPPGDTC